MKVFRFLIPFFVFIALVFNASAQEMFKEITENDVVILYDNDAHCNIDGYMLMAEKHDLALRRTPYVSLVSCGDFAAGKALGTVSKGEYLIRLMNMLKYDYVTLGNHEFDFGIAQMHYLMKELNAKVLCCNFNKVSDENPMFEPYEIKRYGKISVAFIGVATPATISSGNPATYQDGNGNFVYTFGQENLAKIVQKQVDAARAEGADIVVVLSHLGIEPPSITSLELIAQTRGIDVVLDGHSHSVIPQQMVKDQEGKSVLLSSTGTEFANVGALVIHPNGKFSTRLIPNTEKEKGLIEDYDPKDQTIMRKNYVTANPGLFDEIRSNVARGILYIKTAYAEVGNRQIGQCKVGLNIYSTDGVRISRNQECTVGDLAADAMRSVMGADIGWENGGGCRGGIVAGPLTFNSILSVFPFDNAVCVIDVPGQDIIDALEMAAHAAPEEFGGFAQVSGLTYKINTSIPSSVVLDENQFFVKVAGKRRVSDIRVYDAESKTYKKISAKKHYTIAGTEFVLLKSGDGVRFPNAKIVKTSDLVDVMIVEKFIKESLNSTIDKPYDAPQGRIQIVK